MPLAELAPAAPAVPIAGITAALVVLLFTYIVLRGLQHGYDYTLGAVLRGAARIFGSGIPLVGRIIGYPFAKADHFIQEAISVGLKHNHEAIAELFHSLTWLVRETYNAMVALGVATYEAVDDLITHEIPGQVKARTIPLGRDIRAEGVARRALAVTMGAALAAQEAALERELADLFGRARRGIDALRRHDIRRAAWIAAGGLAIALGVRSLINRGVNAKIREILGRIAIPAIGAIALSFVLRISPWLRCSNVRNFNRALCRLPVGFLNDLLGLGVALIALSDLCRMGRVAQGLARFVQQPLLDLVTVADAATQCTSFAEPAPIPLRAAALPQSSDLVNL